MITMIHYSTENEDRGNSLMEKPSIFPHSFLRSFIKNPLSEGQTQQTRSPPWGGCPQPGGAAGRGLGSEGHLLLSGGLDPLAGSGEGLTASGETGQHPSSHALQSGQCWGAGKAGGPRAGVCIPILGLRPWWGLGGHFCTRLGLQTAWWGLRAGGGSASPGLGRRGPEGSS